MINLTQLMVGDYAESMPDGELVGDDTDDTDGDDVNLGMADLLDA